MKRLSIGTGALSGALITAPLMGVMFLAQELAGLPFIPYDVFDWVTRVLPGAVVTFGIDLMIDSMRFAGISVADAAKTAEKVLAILQFFSMGVVGGALFFAFVKQRRVHPDLVTGLVLGALAGLPLTAISIAIGGSDVEPALIALWLAALFLAWGAAIRATYVRLYPYDVLLAPSEGEIGGAKAMDRRQFLVRLGASVAIITVASSGIGSLLAQAARRELDAELAASMAHQSQGSTRAPFPNAGDPVVAAPGTRPEYTPLKDHYKVFIRISPTVIDGETWSLPISGLVDNMVSLTLDDIRSNYESRDQYVTLSCISGRIGTDLISTTQWTGRQRSGHPRRREAEHRRTLPEYHQWRRLP